VHERLRGAHASEVLQPSSDVEGIREIELHTWDEPFEMQAAQDTVRRLYDHYHKQVCFRSEAYMNSKPL